ncbi:cytochrome C [Rhodobacteraceae bacterium WD3A24]|nr:cytochrome C [Rhodobacteraceae bacterium WD3A24]
MNRKIWGGSALVAAALAAYVWQMTSPPDPPAQAAAGASSEGAPIVEVSLPAELSENAQMGERAFDAVCAECHGDNAAGREGMGPPLVHEIYEPGHHSDMAFVLAASNGVRAHHWRFGNMPPVEGITQAEIRYIAAYVRALQRENGIE